jgi:uncharacterized BrkB/YihY/UPF0761 family membrane protein
VSDPTPTSKPDLVDQALTKLDQGIDVVHTKVVRPALIAGRFLSYSLLLFVLLVLVVTLFIIGFGRLLDTYAFHGRVWLTDGVIGLLFVIGGLLLWRRRTVKGPRP